MKVILTVYYDYHLCVSLNTVRVYLMKIGSLSDEHECDMFHTGDHPGASCDAIAIILTGYPEFVRRNNLC